MFAGACEKTVCHYSNGMLLMGNVIALVGYEYMDLVFLRIWECDCLCGQYVCQWPRVEMLAQYKVIVPVTRCNARER